MAKPFTSEKICSHIISALQLDISSTAIKEQTENKSNEAISRNQNSSKNKPSSITRKKSIEKSKMKLFQEVKTSSNNKSIKEPNSNGPKMSQKTENLLSLLSSTLNSSNRS